MDDKIADLAGPGIGDYAELARMLPADYRSLLTPRLTQQAIFAAKDYIEQGLCRERMALRQFGCRARRGYLHGHARGPQGLLPRP